jgi:hypothetical protein
VRQDGDPERDDYGLPRVEVIIPDDARELDRDLIAYRREERQRRRRQRIRRLTGPFTRYGLATPIIALALLIAVVSGTLMTAFGPRSVVPRVSGTPATSGSGTLQPGRPGGLLPDGKVTITGRPEGAIRDLVGLVALVPEGCGCDQAVRDVTAQAQKYNLRRFLVGSHSWSKATAKELRALADTAGNGAKVVWDEAGVLTSTYHASGLTLLLIHTDGVLRDVRLNVRPGLNLQRELEKLRSPGQGLIPTP